MDEQESAHSRPEALVWSTPRVVSVFRDMTFPEFAEDLESDYEPSDEEYDEELAASEEEEEDDTSTEELYERYQDEEQHEVGGDSEEQEPKQEVKLDDDVRWWKSSEEKHRWKKQYRQADAAFRARFGCAIDTPAHPEIRRRVQRQTMRYRVYKFVLGGLLMVCWVQLALVYSASSWALSTVTWRESSAGNIDLKSGMTGRVTMSSNGHGDISVGMTARPSQKQIPDYVRTGLHLCATLSRRVIQSGQDAIVTQHALRACDIAVKFAPENSREAIEAHVLRGDLRSLMSRFDSADEDYKAATMLVHAIEKSGTSPQVALTLLQDLNLKTLVNRWTQLYRTKRFKELRREAKARVVQERQMGEDSHARAVSELAANWLSAFKQKEGVLEVLTLQRRYTLRRLQYESSDGDYTSRR